MIQRHVYTHTCSTTSSNYSAFTMSCDQNTDQSGGRYPPPPLQGVEERAASAVTQYNSIQPAATETASQEDSLSLKHVVRDVMRERRRS